MLTPAHWFLGLNVLLMATALAALVRAPPMGYLNMVYFFAGFPAFHFTNVLLLAWAGVVAIAAVAGAFDSPVGFLGLAISVAVCVALLDLLSRSRRAGEQVERALRQTLGEEFRRGIARLDESYGPTAGLLSNPWRVRMEGVERIGELSYGDAGERNLLDLYRPRRDSGAKLLPVLLWIHGGAWIVGNKTQQGLPLLYRMASRGWITVSINYRLGPANRFPDPLVDVKRAIAWLRECGAQYGADPRFIIACGGSAGGHLAALAALTPNRAQYQPGFEAADTALAAAIPLYGRFDFVDRSKALPDNVLMRFLANNVMPCRYEENRGIWDEASPVAIVGPQAPPMFVAHGSHDCLIPMAEAEAFVAALRRVSNEPVVFARLFGAQHAWDLLNTPWTEHTVNAVHGFAEYVYARYARRNAIALA